MMTPSPARHVLALDDPATASAAVGGKAGGLAQLIQDGLPVPPGFVLTADAFALFLEHNGLATDQIAAQTASEARSQLAGASWPDRLSSDLEAAYANLTTRSEVVSVAVRSSAIGEDSAQASFAGQHSTVLNVSGLDAVRDAVIECWLSLFGEEAMHYRRTHGVDGHELAMPVVVQALVPAEASGVAFTVDPISGDGDVVLIEAAWGLGEGVVAGFVTPDHYRVSKSDGAIVQKDVSSQHVRVVPSVDGGVENEELADEVANQPVLTNAQVAELAELAQRIEEKAGEPRDIEWALADGTFSILQSRPVTGVADVPAEEGWVSEFDTETNPETIWTSANVQEVLPGQLSPFTSSIQLEALEKYGLEPIERMGIKLTNDDPFFAFFYGRAFLNVTMMLDVIDQTPFAGQEALMDQYLSQSRAEAKDFDLTKIPHRPLWKRLLGYIRVFPRMIWYRIQMPKDIKRSEELVAQFQEEDVQKPLSGMSDDELLRTFEADLDRGSEVGITHVSGGGLTSSAFETLRTTTERWLDDEGGELQAKLVTGLSGLESAAPAFELWELSRLVLASDVLRECFDAPTGAEIQRRVETANRDETSAFRRAFATFIQHHGHRSVMEAEAAALSWEEDQATVYTMIKNYLHADPTSSPHRIEERQRKEREEATANARKRLAFWKRPIFNYTLKEAQDWVAMREHTKSLLVRTTDRGRHYSREMARRLVAQGKLADVADLYFLTWIEVKGLFEGGLSVEEAADRVSRRELEDAKNRAVQLPDMFRGRPKPLRPEEMTLPDGHRLEGIPVSPGRVTAKARVILDPRKDAAIEPGEILVAPVTDAGWTPLFIAAAGVVVDIGGTLSHGSTVAREYGLPAVVNVKHGTRMITTGQTITVDGTKGVVVLDSES
jgi:phosphohistidine swiveling domain-containing protein